MGSRSISRQWRFNASLLNDNAFITFIKDELQFYLDTNSTPEISPLTLWDCAKAYLRQIIAFASAKKKGNENLDNNN